MKQKYRTVCFIVIEKINEMDWIQKKKSLILKYTLISNL